MLTTTFPRSTQFATFFFVYTISSPTNEPLIPHEHSCDPFWVLHRSSDPLALSLYILLRLLAIIIISVHDTITNHLLNIPSSVYNAPTTLQEHHHIWDGSFAPEAHFANTKNSIRFLCLLYNYTCSSCLDIFTVSPNSQLST